MKNPKLIIPLHNHDSADEAVYNFVIERGMLRAMLLSHFKRETWVDETNRINTIVEHIAPLLPEGKTLHINNTGRWELTAG